MAKSWAEKLNGAKPAHVSVLDKPFGGLAKGEKDFIATPIMVRDYMKKIRKGRTKTIVEMREEFARCKGGRDLRDDGVDFRAHRCGSRT